ncbi:hypothetical protein ACF0H5_004710 [Mactra antiquata]
MLDFQEDISDSTVCFGSSPPNRPFVAEGSDLFRAVMEDFRQTSDSKLSRAIVDNVLTKKNDEENNKNNSRTSNSYLCKRCLIDTSLCRCYSGRSKDAINRVQWIDQIYDKPLAIEQSEQDKGRCSPLTRQTDFVKPILKHKATCIIIVSE